MPHIHNEPGQHDSTVGAYVIRTDGGEPRALLHMHRKLQKLLPIGGHVELDESVWAALVRELREESGYDISQMMVMQPTARITPDMADDIVVHPQPALVNVHDYSPTHFHSDICYFLTTDQDPQHEPDQAESLDFRWLTYDEVVALTDEQVFPNTRVIYTQLFEQLLDAWEPVPTMSYSVTSTPVQLG